MHSDRSSSRDIRGQQHQRNEKHKPQEQLRLRDEFQIQIEHFQRDLVSALDIITALENDKKQQKNTITRLASERDAAVKDAVEAATAAESQIAELRKSSVPSNDRSIRGRSFEEEKHNKELQQVRSESRDEISAFHERAKHAEDQVSRLEPELERSRIESGRQAERLLELKRRLEEGERSSKEREDIFKKRLENELALCDDREEKRAEELMAELKRSRSECSQLRLMENCKQDAERRAEEQRIELNRCHSEHAQALKKCKQEADERVEEMQMALMAQRAKIEEFHLDCATEQDTVSALDQAIEALETAHNESRNKISKLHAENDMLNDALDEAKSCMRQHRDVLQDAEVSKAKCCELEKSCREKDDRTSKWRSESEGLQRSLVQCQRETTELQGKIASIQGQASAKDDIISKLRRQVEESNAVNDQSRREVEYVQSAMGVQGSQLKEYEEKASRATQLLIEKEGQLREVDTTKAKTMETLSEYERKQALSEVQVQELENSIEKLEAKSYLEEGYEDRMRSLQAKLWSSRKKLSKRDEQLEESKKGIVEAQKMISKLMETVKELRVRVVVLESELESRYGCE